MTKEDISGVKGQTQGKERGCTLCRSMKQDPKQVDVRDTKKVEGLFLMTDLTVL